jgi:hypothetical protein
MAGDKTKMSDQFSTIWRAAVAMRAAVSIWDLHRGGLLVAVINRPPHRSVIPARRKGKEEGEVFSLYRSQVSPSGGTTMVRAHVVRESPL